MSDLISRQAAIDAVGKYLKKDGDVITIADVVDAAVAIGMLPAAEPERKTPDHGYMWICPVCGLEVHSDFRRCVRCGWDRPSAEPERKKGQWIFKAEEFYKAVNEKGGGVNENTPFFVDDIACPECLSMFSVIDNEAERFNFCPNCGSDMRGEEHE